MLKDDSYKNKRRLKAYWQMGNRISRVIDVAGDRGSYGKKIVQNLSDDLTQKYGDGFGTRTINYLRNFAAVYHAPDLNPALDWIHYRALLGIKDDRLRASLEQRVIKDALSKNELVAIIADHRAQASAKNTPFSIMPRTTRPGIFKIVASPSSSSDRPIIDLGFNVQHSIALPGLDAAPGSYVAQQKNARFVPVHIQPGERYCYRGDIVDVIDGDTVKMRLHLGFDISIIETMRLRGVNAMEINFKEGQVAKRALQRMLRSPASLHAFTYHHDKYGRYITDLIVDEHIYVNKQLVENGHARFLKM